MRGRTRDDAARRWADVTASAARGYMSLESPAEAIAAARENYVRGRMTIEDFEARVGEELAREARPP